MSSPSKIPRPIKSVVVLGSTNGRGGEKKTEKKEARDKIRVEKVASPKSTSGASETKNCPPRSPRSSLTQPLRPHPQTRDERKGSRDERKGRDDRKGSASKETVQRSTSASCSRSASKGAMSFTELKKSHQSLLAAKESLEKASREKDAQHQATTSQLANEIKHYKEQNATLKKEINAYQDKVSKRNEELSGLQQKLEEVRFENERMAAVLGRARVDPVSGEQIELASRQEDTQHMMELEFQAREHKIDGFLTSLETALADLKRQKETLLGKDHIVM